MLWNGVTDCAAIVEANSNEDELIFNKEIAPFEVYLASLNTDKDDVNDNWKKFIKIYVVLILVFYMTTEMSPQV